MKTIFDEILFETLPLGNAIQLTSRNNDHNCVRFHRPSLRNCHCKSCTRKNKLLKNNQLELPPLVDKDSIFALESKFELSNNKLNNAIEYNNAIAHSLGWDKYKNKIADFLGLGKNFSESHFANAVASWQGMKKIKPIDGMLGEKTWQFIQAALSLLPQKIMNHLKKGTIQEAVNEGILHGFTNEDVLTDIVFYYKNKNRNGKIFVKSDSDYEDLYWEWLDIKGGIVQPVLGRNLTKLTKFSCNKQSQQNVFDMSGLLFVSDSEKDQEKFAYDELRKQVENSAKDAVYWAYTAAHRIKPEYRTHEDSEIFKEIFNEKPDAISKYWLSKKTNWKDYGELVSIRLKEAAKIIQSGSVPFHCYRTDCNKEYAFTDTKNKNIILCDEFWYFFGMKESTSDLSTQLASRGEMGVTILHEALHLYFRFMNHSDVTSLSNIFCYESFVWRINNLGQLPGWYSSNCTNKSKANND